MSGNVLKFVGGIILVGIPVLIRTCDTSAFRMARHTASELPLSSASDISLAADHARQAAEAAEAAATAASQVNDLANLPNMGGASGIFSPDSAQHRSLAPTTPLPKNLHPIVVALEDLNSSWKSLPGETVEKIKYVHGVKLDTVKKPHLIAAFPTDESQFGNVYSRAPSASSTKEMELLTARLPKSSNSWQWSKFPGHSTFSQELKSLTASDLVGIIAHSEDEGRTLVLPNGSRIDFAKLHEICTDQQKVCVVLSCFSDDLKINTEITTADALAMWNSAMKKWQSEPTWSSDEFILEIRKSRMKMVNRRRIYLTTIVGTGLVGSGSYQLTSSRQK